MVKRIDNMDRTQTSVCDCRIRIDRKQFCNMKPKVKKLDVLSMHLDCATAKQDRTNQESQAESYVFMLRTLLRLGLPSGARKAWKSWLKCRFSSKKQGLVGLELGDGLCSGGVAGASCD